MEEHESTSSDGCSEVGRNAEEVAKSLADGRFFLEGFRLGDPVFDGGYLFRDLLFGSVGVDLADDVDAFFALVVIHQLSRRFRTPDKKDTKGN